MRRSAETVLSVWLALTGWAVAQHSPIPAGHAVCASSCPEVSLRTQPPVTNFMAVCVSNSVSICVTYPQTNGCHNNRNFKYGEDDVEILWTVYGVNAVPSSGKGECAHFVPLSPGVGTVTFEMTADRDEPMSCRHNETIARDIEVYEVDLDIDSLNQRGLSLPGGSLAEDGIEHLFDRPGKIIGVNNGDIDMDGVPNFADGMDIFDNQGSAAGGGFTPVVVRLPYPINMEKATIRFDYDASPPAEVQRQGAGTADQPYEYYPGGQGRLRLWKAAANATRRVAEVDGGGDYIDSAKTYPISSLGSARTITLYVEGIRPSSGMADAWINVTVDPDGEAGPREWICGDSVRCTLFQADMLVDGNRDGMITFHPDDRTTPSRRFRFWLNNDRDRGDDDEAEDLEPASGQGDGDDEKIACLRDLEDFAPIAMYIAGPPVIYDMIANGTLQVAPYMIKTAGSPAFRFFRSAGQSEQYEYLINADAARAQLADDRYTRSMGRLGPATRFMLPAGPNDLLRIMTPDRPTAYMLYEAIGAGQAHLFVTMFCNRMSISASSPVCLETKDIKGMYEHWTVGDSTEVEASAIPDAAREVNGFRYDAQSRETGDYLLFVHGWNMEAWERRYFAETAYKRLFWAGYRGRFGLYSWPTETAIYPLLDPGNYNRSEFKSWKSAAGLHRLLTDLDRQYPGKVRMMAHSMGNVVASEALRKQTSLNGGSRILHTYFACQAASVAHAYDPAVENIESNFSTDTPEVYAKYPPTGLPYFRDLKLASGKSINLHNSSDYALNKWQLNQDMKPSRRYAHGVYNLQLAQKRWMYDEEGWGALMLDISRHTYMIYSFVAEARSRALGAEPEVKGAITQGFNLQKLQYKYGEKDYEHSAQFRSIAAHRVEIWLQIMDIGELK